MTVVILVLAALFVFGIWLTITMCSSETLDAWSVDVFDDIKEIWYK